MGIASLILGVISIVLAIIPYAGLFLAPVPTLLGLGLGLADLIARRKRRDYCGVAVAGTLVSAFALAILLGWLALFSLGKPENPIWWETSPPNSESSDPVDP